MDYNTQDRIDAYIRGEMNASKQASFLKELSNNIELQKDYEFTRNVVISISDRERKKSQIREWNKKSHKTIYTYLTITGIAVMLIVGLFLFPYIPSNNPITIYEGNSSLSSDNYYAFTEISQLIAEQNYEMALQHIEEEGNYYLILANDSTVSSKLIGITENIYKLKWLKVQTLLGLKRIEDACIILEELSNSNCQYKEWADSLWMELQ